MRIPSPGTRQYLGEINVVPLVDVVLVLLIIFMITAPLLYRGIDLSLPQTAANTIQPDERAVLSITQQEGIYLDQQRLSEKELPPVLRRLRQERPDIAVYLRADRNVPYGVVLRVMDAVKLAGIERLGMVTEPLEQEPL